MAITTMDLDALLSKLDDQDADVDFLAEAVRMLAQALMEADVSARIGAGGVSVPPTVGPPSATATATAAGTPVRGRSI